MRESILQELASTWERTKASHPILLHGVTPTLVVVTAGPTEASAAYLKHKRLACEKVGFTFRHESFPSVAMDGAAVYDAVKRIAASPLVHGIIVQMPLPDHIDPRKVYEAVPASKDVDGLGARNQGLLQLGLPSLLPCTPQGIVEVLWREKLLNKPGQKVAILGRSSLVGRPIANMLSQPGIDAMVTMLHSKVPLEQRREVTRGADVIISATGRHGTITPEDVSEGVVLIDVGINFVDDATRKSGRRMVGDVDPATYEKCSLYTPVPGGVGPMTVAMLIRNVLLAVQRQYGVEELPNEWRSS